MKGRPRARGVSMTVVVMIGPEKTVRIKADRWTIEPSRGLVVYGPGSTPDSERVVAAFAPGAWSGVLNEDIVS